MDLGNICALFVRVIVLILQVYGIILSSFYILPSCHFISAVSTNDEIHGVGLKTFETDKSQCIPHNAFIKQHYNGMEMASKVCGYVAPGLACLTILWLFGECCKKGGCWSGKCIPGLLMLFTVICQGLTFLMFNSTLFCKNEDIKACTLGIAAYKSIQATVIYAVAFLLYYLVPSPKPLTGMVGNISSRTVATANSSKSGESTKKKKSKPKSAPDAGEEGYTKEMYAQRRKEKKIKSRGVSGRSKREIFDDLNGGDEKEKEEPYDESQIILYDPETGERKEDERKRSSGSGKKSSQPRFDDYVDEPDHATSPLDGMDWSAYSPNERDEYQERKRAKKKKREQERREQERREAEKQRQYEEDRRQRYNDRYPAQDDETHRSEYTEDDYYRRPSGDGTAYTEDQYDNRGYDDRGRGYDDRYEDSYSSNDYGYSRHEDSYRSSRSGDRRGTYDYDDGYSYQSGQDEYSAYDSRADDGYYDEPQDDDRYYGRGGGSGRGDDSYGYDSRADDYYESPRSRSDRGGYYS
ncbi:hypothetical protein ACHAXN_008393 [Cyclotella atomus]